MKRREKIEKRKRQLWIYILGFYVDWECSPLLQEMADNAFGDDKMTREGARYILKLLEKDGKIKIEPKKRRGVKLVVPKKEGGEESGSQR